MAFQSYLIDRSRLRDLLLILCVLFFRPSFPLFWTGVGMFVAGTALKFWAKGTLTRRKGLVTGGPYAFCRHPFYLSNLFLDLSLCLMAGNLWLVATYVPMFMAVYLPVIRREEEYLQAYYPAEMASYKVANRLIPQWPSEPQFKTEWKFSRLLREKEISRFLRLLGVVVLFFWIQLLRHWWWEGLEIEGLIFPMTAILLQLFSRTVYISFERPNRYPTRRRLVNAGMLAACAVLFAMITVDGIFVCKSDLQRLAARNNAEAVDTLQEVRAAAKTSKPMVVVDDFWEEMPPQQIRSFKIERTVILDFEAYHLVVPLGKAA